MLGSLVVAATTQPSALSLLSSSSSSLSLIASSSSTYASFGPSKFIKASEAYLSNHNPNLSSTQPSAPSATSTSQWDHLGTIIPKLYTSSAFSDIIIRAFDQEFRLHRIVLLTNPYFRTMLEGRWAEQSKAEVALSFDDEFITLEALKVVFSRIYRVQKDSALIMTSKTVRNLLATASFFDDQELLKSCIDFIISTLDDYTLVPYLTFAETHFYGQASETIIEACVTLLCRDGFDRLRRPCLIDLPFHWLARLFTTDCLYVPSERDRYLLMRDVFEEREALMSKTTSRLASPISSPQTQHPPSLTSTPANLQDTETLQLTDSLFEDTDDTESLAASASAAAVAATAESIPHHRHLIETAIFYPHLKLKDLLNLQRDRHAAPPEILHRALWTQQELRLMIEKSGSHVTHLGIHYAGAEVPKLVGGVLKVVADDKEDDVTAAGAGLLFDLNLRNSSQAIVPPQDTESIDSKRIVESLKSPPNNYSQLRYPPFRFGAEFKETQRLRKGYRIASQMSYYAGSYWVVYLQKVIGDDGASKLGIYLQRWKHDGHNPESNEGSSDPYAPDDIDFYIDPRLEVHAWFQMTCFIGTKCYILESKPDGFKSSQSWGWRSAKLYKEAIAAANIGMNFIRCSVVVGHV